MSGKENYDDCKIETISEVQKETPDVFILSCSQS